MAVAPGRGLRQPKAGAANILGERHYLWRDVERGVRNPTLSLLERLARTLEVSLAELMQSI
jgi:transcriptional regulator with XRE-family HTH domain